MVDRITVSPKASREVIVVGDDVVHLDKLKVDEERGRLTADMGYSTIHFSKRGNDIVVSVERFTGETNKGYNVTSTTECVGDKFAVFTYGPNYPERRLPIAVYVSDEGKKKEEFGVIPVDKSQRPHLEHGAIQPHIAMHVKLSKYGFVDVEGARRLLKLVDEGKVDTKEWEISPKDHEEFGRRLKSTLQAIIKDHEDIGDAARHAVKFWEVANREDVKERIPNMKEKPQEPAKKHFGAFTDE